MKRFTAARLSNRRAEDAHAPVFVVFASKNSIFPWFAEKFTAEIATRGDSPPYRV
jgi:hypothetical protein